MIPDKECARLAQCLTVKLISPEDIGKQVAFTLRCLRVPRQGRAKLREEMRERVFEISGMQKMRLRARGWNV